MRSATRPWWVLAALVAGALWSACQVYPDDAETSSFDLEGAHRDLTCGDCHGADLDESPPSRCGGCHDGDRPVLHWDDDCGECHGQDRWDDLTFEHEEWPLTGAHVDTPCEDCHTGGDFEDVGEACEDCHVPPPFHADEDCGHCHSTSSWHL